ncbi:MAG: LUD domain-containing protein [Desulfovibrio sp.]|nr:LUD domain-containing protein [Desulfovibrio sp.]
MSGQDTKNAILERIRAGKPEGQPLPDVPMYPWRGDLVSGFIERLLSFDGRAIKFKDRDSAIAWLKTQPELAEGKQVYSSAEGFAGNVTDADLADLHAALKLDSCVTEGCLGVGEMGSIWVTDESLGHAVCGLLTRRLFILLDAAKIKGGLHEAYASLKLRDHQYGSFFTGPSATADIEAVRITGAQGPLAMTAVLYNCGDAPAGPELMVSANADKSAWQLDE